MVAARCIAGGTYRPTEQLGTRGNSAAMHFGVPPPRPGNSAATVSGDTHVGGEPSTLFRRRRAVGKRAVGLVNREVRELLATYYQFDAPFVVDDHAFTTAFGGYVTGWDEIVETTLDAYRRT